MTVAGPLRDAAAPALAALVRRFGDFDGCEDALQEALVAANAAWREQGVPDNPVGWLVRAGSRRYLDALRTDTARVRREERAAAQAGPGAAPAADEVTAARDDTLALMFLCCHPALTAPSQLALVLRAVSGLTTAEIASAFLVPESTMAQRVSRAKQRLREAGARFEAPGPRDARERLPVVLHALYLVHTEGHTASSGPRLERPDLTAEAIRLTRRVRAAYPASGEADGLLALMLLSRARTAARTDAGGALLPLTEQDRSLWDRALIEEASVLLTGAMSAKPVGPYQLQAAIAALHCEAPTAGTTDWPQIVLLYDLLAALTPGPVVLLNRAVAVGMARGADAGLAALAGLDDGPPGHRHRLGAVRGHLLAQRGDPAEAAACYREAARTAGSVPERRFLLRRAAEEERAAGQDGRR